MTPLKQTLINKVNSPVVSFKTVSLNFKIPTFEFIKSLKSNKPFVEKKKKSSNIPSELQIGISKIYSIDIRNYLSQIGFKSKASFRLSSLSIEFNTFKPKLPLTDEFKNNFYGNLKH